VEMVIAAARRWISSSDVMCWRLRLSEFNLYRGPFMKVARVDLAEEVAYDTVGHTSGLCMYGCSLSLH
jgi:hypothetical protein